MLLKYVVHLFFDVMTNFFFFLFILCHGKFLELLAPQLSNSYFAILQRSKSVVNSEVINLEVLNQICCSSTFL